MADVNAVLSSFGETLLAPVPQEYDPALNAEYQLGRLPCANCIGAQLQKRKRGKEEKKITA
jgi:hypothetical protein